MKEIREESWMGCFLVVFGILCAFQDSHLVSTSRHFRGNKIGEDAGFGSHCVGQTEHVFFFLARAPGETFLCTHTRIKVGALLLQKLERRRATYSF